MTSRSIIQLSVACGIFVVFGAGGRRYEVVDGAIEALSEDAASLLRGANSDLFDIVRFIALH